MQPTSQAPGDDWDVLASLLGSCYVVHLYIQTCQMNSLNYVLFASGICSGLLQVKADTNKQFIAGDIIAVRNPQNVWTTVWTIWRDNGNNSSFLHNIYTSDAFGNTHSECQSVLWHKLDHSWIQSAAEMYSLVNQNTSLSEHESVLGALCVGDGAAEHQAKWTCD